MSTVAPGPGLTTATAAAAVRPAMVRVAAVRSSTPSGVWCASPPAVMVPVPSTTTWSATARDRALRPNRVAVSASEVMNQSIGFRPAAVTRTRICPGPPAWGTGTSRTLKASGPPNDANWTARLVVADVVRLGSIMLTGLL